MSALPVSPHVQENAIVQVPLRFESVSVAFNGEYALKNVTFEVQRGHTVILLGASGSGKTTLLKTALGLLKPDQGRILLFDRDVTGLEELDWFDLRSRVGVLFQEGGLFDSLTIEENVAYPLENQPGLKPPGDQLLPRVEQSLQFVELGHTLEKFPSELSGGMRRRVGIARAIVTEPELLLYDSPTAGLDPITANTIIALIVKGRDLRHTTTVMATHRYQDGKLLAACRFDPETRRLVADESAAAQTHFLVLKEGEIVFFGSSEELENSADPYVGKFGGK